MNCCWWTGDVLVDGTVVPGNIMDIACAALSLTLFPFVLAIENAVRQVIGVTMTGTVTRLLLQYKQLFHLTYSWHWASINLSNVLIYEIQLR